MINKKVLLIATYPISNPQHGGQKRVKAIYDFYKTIFTDVKFVGVFYEKFYQDYGTEDCPIKDEALIKRIEDLPFLGDLTTGEAIYTDPHVKRKLTGILATYQPDIVQIEQAYPYEGLRHLLDELAMRPKLVFSSHNVESKLKQEILVGLKVPAKDRHTIVAKVLQIESTLAKEADLAIAVSKSDARIHRKMGAKKCVVVPNGIQEVIPTQAALKHWGNFKKDNNILHAITFVGSAHPPNLFGFQEMIGEDLSFLPTGTRLLLAGGIAEYLQEVYKFWEDSHKSFWERVTPLGRLSDDNLAGLIQESEVLLLPITQGGGSNLKTAEAILSGRKVVATRYAFRAFEQYMDLPNIYITDDPTDFRKLITEAVSTQYIGRSAKQIQQAQHVKWEYCLAPLGGKLEVLVYGGVGALLIRLRRLLARAYNFIRRSLNS
jgi:hypothetical protein